MLESAGLHLAHPERLWLLPLVVGVWTFWLWRRQPPSPWAEVIEPRLLQELSRGDERERRWNGPLLLLAGLLLAVLALAEPRLSGDGDRLYQRTSAVVVVLDLSTPEAPSPALSEALERWLPGTRVPQVGLLAVAGSSHEVVPPTPDTAMVLRQLQWLTTDTMPEPGLDLAAALTRAEAIFERAELSNAAVVVVGDGHTDAAALARAKRLAEDGIPVHRVVSGAPDTAAEELARHGGGTTWAAADFTRQDPLPRGPGYFTRHSHAGEGPDPRRLGPWLVLLLVLMAGLGLRRGWLLAALPLMLLPPPLPAFEFAWEDESTAFRVEHLDRWRTADQAAMAAYRAGDHLEAAEMFDDPEWRGMAYYRAGRYLQAAGAFATIDTPRSHYNRGNALVRANRLGEAIAAYETALERDPEHADARHNRDRVSAYLDARRSVVQTRQEEAAEGRATFHPGPLLQDDPAEFWKRKFELDLRRQRPGSGG